MKRDIQKDNFFIFKFFLPLVTLVFVFPVSTFSVLTLYISFYFILISFLINNTFFKCFLIINNVLRTKTKINEWIIILERVMKSFKNENVF